MPKKIATFSNGHVDIYKGSRDVRAAWMITRMSDGAVLMSGHSLDRARADRTARGNLRYLATDVGVEQPPFDVPQRLYAGASYGWLFEKARSWGFEGSGMAAYKRWARAMNEERMAEIAARTMIEVVDI